MNGTVYTTCRTCGAYRDLREMTTGLECPACAARRAQVEQFAEQNRLLLRANHTLARGLQPAMLALWAAALAWQEAIDPGRPNGVHAAEQALLSAIERVRSELT